VLQRFGCAAEAGGLGECHHGRDGGGVADVGEQRDGRAVPGFVILSEAKDLFHHRDAEAAEFSPRSHEGHEGASGGESPDQGSHAAGGLPVGYRPQAKSDGAESARCCTPYFRSKRRCRLRQFHAPKGIGALYVRRQVPFAPFIHGGHQENNRRGVIRSTSHELAGGDIRRTLSVDDAKFDLQRVSNCELTGVNPVVRICGIMPA
jgi:hypothetical protein